MILRRKIKAILKTLTDKRDNFDTGAFKSILFWLWGDGGGGGEGGRG